jgi:hypothetical protein
MKKLLALAAVAEALTGIALFADPPLLVKLLFGAELAGAGILVGRVAGIGLTSLAVACWPGDDRLWALRGITAYNVLATVYLGYVAFKGEPGILLWPVVVLHAVLSLLLVREWWRTVRTTKAQTI